MCWVCSQCSDTDCVCWRRRNGELETHDLQGRWTQTSRRTSCGLTSCGNFCGPFPILVRSWQFLCQRVGKMGCCWSLCKRVIPGSLGKRPQKIVKAGLSCQHRLKPCIKCWKTRLETFTPAFYTASLVGALPGLQWCDFTWQMLWSTGCPSCGPDMNGTSTLCPVDWLHQEARRNPGNRPVCPKLFCSS